MTNYFKAFFISILLWATVAQAHDMHGKPQHGGVVAEAGVFQAELVLKQSDVTIYLTEHGKNISTKGATGKLTGLSEGKTYSADLTPSAVAHQLQAKLAVPVKSGKFVAQITLAGKPATSVRFEVK